MMADFSKAMISTFERVKLFDRFSHRMRLLQSSRSELALAELCLPFPSVVRLLLVVIPHATTLFVFRSSCKLPLFPFIHRIISKYLVFFLLFHPIPYPSHKERRHVLLEVRNNMKDHLARLLHALAYRSGMSSSSGSILRHSNTSKTYILPHHPVSCFPLNMKSIQMWKGVKFVKRMVLTPPSGTHDRL